MTDISVNRFFCRWREDEDSVWWTDCDNAFVLSDGTPEENAMKFCCYCGKVLKQETYQYETGDVE